MRQLLTGARQDAPCSFAELHRRKHARVRITRTKIETSHVSWLDGTPARILLAAVGMAVTQTHTVLRPVKNGPVVHAWDQGVPMEPDVWRQVEHLASVPGVERIAIMPDGHIGKGACVG